MKLTFVDRCLNGILTLNIGIDQWLLNRSHLIQQQGILIDSLSCDSIESLGELLPIDGHLIGCRQASFAGTDCDSRNQNS